MQLIALRISILALTAHLLVDSCPDDRALVEEAQNLAVGEQCSEDAQCDSSFCDLQRCSPPQGVYGRTCAPAPRTSEGIRDGKLHFCGAYLCLDGRCRSCSRDQQCQSELGSPTCYRSDDRPGARCGDPPNEPGPPGSR